MRGWEGIGSLAFTFEKGRERHGTWLDRVMTKTYSAPQMTASGTSGKLITRRMVARALIVVVQISRVRPAKAVFESARV